MNVGPDGREDDLGDRRDIGAEIGWCWWAIVLGPPVP